MITMTASRSLEDFVAAKIGNGDRALIEKIMASLSGDINDLNNADAIWRGIESVMSKSDADPASRKLQNIVVNTAEAEALFERAKNLENAAAYLLQNPVPKTDAEWLAFGSFFTADDEKNPNSTYVKYLLEMDSEYNTIQALQKEGYEPDYSNCQKISEKFAERFYQEHSQTIAQLNTHSATNSAIIGTMSEFAPIVVDDDILELTLDDLVKPSDEHAGTPQLIVAPLSYRAPSAKPEPLINFPELLQDIRGIAADELVKAKEAFRVGKGIIYAAGQGIGDATRAKITKTKNGAKAFASDTGRAYALAKLRAGASVTALKTGFVDWAKSAPALVASALQLPEISQQLSLISTHGTAAITAGVDSAKQGFKDFGQKAKSYAIDTHTKGQASATAMGEALRRAPLAVPAHYALPKIGEKIQHNLALGGTAIGTASKKGQAWVKKATAGFPSTMARTNSAVLNGAVYTGAFAADAGSALWTAAGFIAKSTKEHSILTAFNVAAGMGIRAGAVALGVSAAPVMLAVAGFSAIVGGSIRFEYNALRRNQPELSWQKASSLAINRGFQALFTREYWKDIKDGFKAVPAAYREAQLAVKADERAASAGFVKRNAAVLGRMFGIMNAKTPRGTSIVTGVVAGIVGMGIGGVLHDALQPYLENAAHSAGALAQSGAHDAAVLLSTGAKELGALTDKGLAGLSAGAHKIYEDVLSASSQMAPANAPAPIAPQVVTPGPAIVAGVPTDVAPTTHMPAPQRILSDAELNAIEPGNAAQKLPDMNAPTVQEVAIVQPSRLDLIAAATTDKARVLAFVQGNEDITKLQDYLSTMKDKGFDVSKIQKLLNSGLKGNAADLVSAIEITGQGGNIGTGAFDHQIRNAFNQSMPIEHRLGDQSLTRNLLQSVHDNLNGKLDNKVIPDMVSKHLEGRDAFGQKFGASAKVDKNFNDVLKYVDTLKPA